MSLRSNLDRYNLLDVPNYTKMIDTIYKIKDRPWIRASLAVMLATGGRVSEILYLKRGNIKFLDYGGKELPNDKVNLHDTAIIQFNMYTEKNRKTKYRVVPLIKNELFLPLAEVIVDYCKEFQFDDTLLFPYTRSAMWYAVKRNIGKDFYCHYLRHVAVTNDSRAGINQVIQQSKFGWSDTRPGAFYTHLNVKDQIMAQREALGAEMPKADKFLELTKKAEDGILNSMTANVEARKEYNNVREFSSPPVREERGVMQEAAAHAAEKPAPDESELLKKVVKEIVKLPEFKETPLPAPEIIDYPIEPEPRKQYEEKYKPVGTLQKDTSVVAPTKIKPEGVKHFEEGMIVKDKVVLVDSNRQRTLQMDKVYDPRRYIVAYKPSKGVLTKIARGTMVIPKPKKRLEQEYNESLVAVV